MASAREHDREEDLAPGAAPATPSASPALSAFQQGLGNQRVARLLSSPAALAREYVPSPPAQIPDWDEEVSGDEGAIPLAPPTAAAPAQSTFKRPKPTDISASFADFNAAVAHMNGGAFIGEAQTQFEAKAGKIQVSGSGSAYTASVSVTWSVGPQASMKIWNPTWPNMSADEKKAVANMRAALLAHEQMHFEVCEKTIAGFAPKIEATGTSQQGAVDALKALAPTQMQTWQTEIEKADKAYDAKTNHGRSQDAVGGTNVELKI